MKEPNRNPERCNKISRRKEDSLRISATWGHEQGKRGLPGGEISPRKNAAAPDMFPAELYRNCGEAHPMIAGLFDSMQECDYIPNALRQFYTAPLDKAGGNRARSAKK